MSYSPPTPVVFISPDEFGVERVFPIRNLVGDGGSFFSPEDREGEVSPATDEEAVAGTRTAGTEHGGPTTTAMTDPMVYLPPPYPLIPPKDSIRKLPPSTSELHKDGEGSGVEREELVRRFSERSQFAPSTSGVPGVMISTTGDDGKTAFYHCDDEPIHTPGAIQQFGALLVLKYDQVGNLEVRIASENTEKLLQYSPEQLFGLKSFTDILEDDYREDLVARVDNALDNIGKPSADTYLDVFTTSIKSSLGTPFSLWCAIHVAHGTDDLVICEFEKFSDIFYLDSLHDKKQLPASPINLIENEVTPEERLKSTTSGSLPLRGLQIARKRTDRSVSMMDIFNTMGQAQAQLGAATSVQNLLDTLVGLISELTGFHRVMLYRFDSDKNGCVDSELVDPNASSDIYLGLHFPASDIPAQARELYKVNRIRLLYDRDEETARLVCRDVTDFEKKLDLTHSYLRAMSPIHLKYLANMGVRSSMSVSIVIDSELWGLIACHEYGDVGLRVTLPVRELCRNIGECASINIQRLIMLQRVASRKPPPVAPPRQSPSGFIAASSTDLLRLFGADFGLLSIQDEARAIGRLDPYREALAILAHLQSRRFTNILASQNINHDFPDLKYPPGINILAGLLVIPLSMGGKDFLVFFRKGQLNEVRWAGNPHDKVHKAGSQYLEPRASFKRWTETIVGMSKEWTEDELDTASVLSLLYGRFIEIWRQKESAGYNNRMTRLLIRNSAHEVRTPLNAIVNYLEMALENKIDEATRDILVKAHNASRSLIYVIDDLLNLTKAEEGKVVSMKESFDLGATVAEVMAAFRKEAMRKGLDLTVSTHQGIPEMVKGDPSRLRQVLSNVTSNAFQHSVAGGIKVDIRLIRLQETSSVIGITVQDVGIGMSENQLDDLFLEFEQIMDEDSPDTSMTTPASEDSQSIGIGLAVVARYVRNMNGQIRVRSELGKGTIFGIELPFEHSHGTPVDEGVITSKSVPPRRLQSADPAILRFQSDSSVATVEPPSLSELKIQAGKDAIPESEMLSPTINPSSLDQLGTDVTSPEADDTTSSLASPTDSRLPNFPFPDMGEGSMGLRQERLNVLVAEDNPINARLLTRRLRTLGHMVEVSVDGQECHDSFASNPAGVDVILMDIQMPLVDGDLSTRMIRHYEQELEELREVRPRVPIIAVSASLMEANRFVYVESGFDGWILKPIDFKRLDLLLQGIKRPELRRHAVYTPGQWEMGGWFLPG